MSEGKRQLYVSTAALKDKSDLAQVLYQYYEMGLRHVEISGGHRFKPLEELVALLRGYQEKGMKFIFHNYFPAPKESFVLNCLSQNMEIRAQSKELVSNAVNLANELKVDLYCLHPGYLSDPRIGSDGMFYFSNNGAMAKDEWLKAFFNDFMPYYNQLALKNGAHQIYVGIENLFPPAKGENHSLFCTKEEVMQIFEHESVRNSELGILIDLAHLTIAANILKFDRDEFLDEIIERYGDRIYEVHLSGDDGYNDVHAPVKEDSWQIKTLKRFGSTGLRSTSGPTKVCIESRGLTGGELLDNYNLIRKCTEVLV